MCTLGIIGNAHTQQPYEVGSSILILQIWKLT